MTLVMFAQKLVFINDKGGLNALICEFINDHSEGHTDEELRTVVNGLGADHFTAFGGSLGYCRNYCLEELKKEENKSEVSYIKKLEESDHLLDRLSKIYQDVISTRVAATATTDESAALAQQKRVLLELNEKIRAFRKEFDESKNEMKAISASINDKIFSVLINTVSILGIFVTIAFAGFGVATIFSNIDLAASLASEEAFVKNVFYLMLTSWLSYNILLLLIYFIFKVSRPILLNEQGVDERNISFSKLVNLKPFLWVDASLAVITIVIFLCCLLIW